MGLHRIETLLHFWTSPPELVQIRLAALVHDKPFNSLGLQIDAASRNDWYSMCFNSMSRTDRILLRGSMHNPIGGTARLSEHGEAIQQSLGSGTDYRGSLQIETPVACWYALRTFPKHEKRVHEGLGLRGIESFLPLYETLHHWKNGCKALVELPLFSGYIFVKINSHGRSKVLSLAGAISIVGSASGPWPLPDAEVESLRDGLRSHRFEPHPYLTVGQKVRIKSGPLADLTGYLVRNSGGLRVVLSVEMIGQAAAVEVKAEEVDPIGPAPAGFDA